ncbi:MAG: hypothetical protein JNK90_03010 [Planctomycetaceae bacterium]|nr:hypothetical protein [Planctomycetaceae bacterium]
MIIAFPSIVRRFLRSVGLPLRPRTLAEISTLELRRDRVGHQQKIGALNRQIESIEANKEVLFKKGVASPSDSARLDVARHLSILDLDIKGKNNTLRILFKELEAITGLLIIKENQEFIRQNGLTSVISRMNLDQLTAFVHESTVEGELQWDKLQALCSTLNDSQQIGAGESQSPSEKEYFRAMQTASNNILTQVVLPSSSTKQRTIDESVVS